MTTFQDMAAQEEKDLQKEIEKAEREKVNVRMHLIAQQEKDTSKAKKTRKTVAQLKTARRQKQLGIS